MRASFPGAKRLDWVLMVDALYRSTRVFAARDHRVHVLLAANRQAHCLDDCRFRDRFHMREARSLHKLVRGLRKSPLSETESGLPRPPTLYFVCPCPMSY